MSLTVKLFATLRESRQKVLDIGYIEGITGKLVLKNLNIDEKDVAIFLIDGRDGNPDMLLKDGSTLSIFPPVGGG